MNRTPPEHKPLLQRGAELRDLTVIGWFFGIIAIGMILAGAVAFYLFDPMARYLGIRVSGGGPAILIAIPLATVAFGFYKAAEFTCGLVGLRFHRDSAALPTEKSDSRS
ncbi:MAG: hypothetical protein JNM43_29550 [Planctomycetaceae bacterium]|nr:hypothetical protein [Planctomycetaceae bacterium]